MLCLNTFRRRPWYHRVIVNSDKTSISTAYMDSAGVGKIISVSQAVFEGMPVIADEECDKIEGQKPGGCQCSTDDDCVSGKDTSIIPLKSGSYFLLLGMRSEFRLRKTRYTLSFQM